MNEIFTHRSGMNDLNSQLRIERIDEPNLDKNETYCKYQIWTKIANEWNKGCRIDFQKGPHFRPANLENAPPGAVNGISNEVLVAILMDRLKHTQMGKAACRETALAITELETALLWMFARTRDRQQREVEGLPVK